MSEGHGSGGGFLRELLVRVGFVHDEKSAEKVEGAIEGIKKHLEHLAEAFAVYEVFEFIQKTAEMAEQLKAQAERIGTTTQALQGLNFAAQLSHSSAEALGAGLNFLSRSAFAAAEGSKEAQAAFTKLGVHVKDSNGKLRNTDEIMLDVAEGISKIESRSERSALAMKVLGRGAGELIPMLSKGKEGILEYRQELEELGGTFDSDFVDLSERYMESLIQTRAAMYGVGAAMGKGLLPFLTRVVDRFLQFWKYSGGIIRSGLEKFFAGVGHAIDGMAQIAEAFIYPLVTGLASIADWVGNLDDGFLVLAGAIGIVAATMTGFLAPWLVIAAAIALIVEDIYTFFTGGDSVIGDVGLAFYKLASQVIDFFDNAVDSVVDRMTALYRDVTHWFSRIGDFAEGIGHNISDLLMAPLKALGIAGNTSVTQEIVSTASGAASVAPSFGAASSVFAPSSVSNQITVHASPGMDEEALSSAVVRKLEAHEDARNREAYQALVPAFGG